MVSNENWDAITCSDGTNQVAGGFVKMPYDGYNGLYVRELSNEWTYHACTFTGVSQVKIYFMTQPGQYGVNGGQVLVDNISIYEGNCLDACNAWIAENYPSPGAETDETPEVEPTGEAGDETPDVEPTTEATEEATAEATEEATAEATAETDETPIPVVEPNDEATAEATEEAAE